MTAKAKGKDSTLTASTVEQMIADAINTLMTKVGKLGVESVITDPGIDEFWKGQIGNLFNNTVIHVVNLNFFDNFTDNSNSFI